MELDPIKIRIYRKSNGRSPFTQWLESIKDPETILRIETRLDRVRVGHLGDFKSVGMGIFELRFHWGPGYRIYFARQGNIVIILLTGGDKSTQGSDIRRSLEYWMDYRSRINETL